MPLRPTTITSYKTPRLREITVPVGSIFGILLLVFFVNVPLRKLMRNRRFVFSALELTVIWMMLIVAVGIPSMGLLQFLLPSLVAVRYFATTENDWSETLHRTHS